MNFLGIGGFEWLVIGLIAFLVLGAKGMADGARTVRKVVKDLRSQGDELRTMVKEAVAMEEQEEAAKKAPKPPSGAIARPAGSRPVHSLPSSNADDAATPEGGAASLPAQSSSAPAGPVPEASPEGDKGA